MEDANPTCPFCMIIEKKAPAQILHTFERGDALAIVPLEPVVAGHVLIIPRTHRPDFISDPSVAGVTMAYASLYAKRVGGDWNLITSAGPASTQTIKHLHLHLIPRTPDDGIILPWTPKENVA